MGVQAANEGYVFAWRRHSYAWSALILVASTDQEGDL